MKHPSPPLSRRMTLAAAGAVAGAALAASGPSTLAQGADARRIMFVSLPLKPEAREAFVATMRDNARASRTEEGNLSFDAYAREEGGNELFLFERWRDAAALEAHMRTPHLRAVEAGVPAALSGAPTEVDLVELSPPVAPRRPASPATTRNVLVSLHLRPDARDRLVAALLDVVAPSRAAPGNVAFDVLQDRADRDSIFLMERWDSVAAHEAHLGQPYNGALNAVFPSSLARPLGDGRRLARDVAP